MTASHPLPISALRAHPANPNRLTGRNRRILARHLERAGRCPPIIVRPHPTETDRYEIIDGHHRAAIARELGGWSERVEDPEDAGNAILRAKQATEEGRTCLLEFVTSAETAFSNRS